MDIEKYKELSEKTLSENFNADMQTKTALLNVVDDLLKDSSRLDMLKKVIFYNKDVELDNKIDPFNTFDCTDKSKQKVLHGAIGMVTEAVELLESVVNSIKKGEDFDVPHVREEMFDSMWYFALLLRELNISFESGLDNNIAKLKARFGDKFTEEGAENRDLDAERKILEKGLEK